MRTSSHFLFSIFFLGVRKVNFDASLLLQQLYQVISGIELLSSKTILLQKKKKKKKKF